MPRIRVEVPVSIPAFVDPDDEQGESLDDALSSAKPKAKRKTAKASPSRIDRAFREFDELFKGSRWKTDPSKIRAEHAIAFYVRLHEKVYGVRPAELEKGDAWIFACTAAKRLIEGDRRAFDDGAKLFEFILWTWQKESDRVKWLRDNDKPIAKRITWNDQFVRGFKLTDYWQAMAEAKERGKRR
jgi:hypothetical protein